MSIAEECRLECEADRQKETGVRSQETGGRRRAGAGGTERGNAFRLECEADAIIRRTHSDEGEYPAYVEGDLQRNAKRRGEIREVDMTAEEGTTDDADAFPN